MAFMKSNGNVISFASPTDVQNIDQRVFEANEGLTDEVVFTAVKRATERVLTKMRSTAWWKAYYTKRDTTTNYTNEADIPAVNANRILDRQADFTDLCVFVALSEYILPKIADFGTEDNAERQKIGFYTQRSDALFMELVQAGDWYDFDGSGTVSSREKAPGVINLKRVR